MKAFAALILILASSTSFAAIKEQACYKASNPGEIKAEREDGKKSFGKRATLKLTTETDPYSDSGESKIAKLRIVTTDESRIMVWANVNPGMKTKLPTYQVECDGGSMTVKKIDANTLLLNSDYIAGEVTNLEEGCSNARMTFEDLIVKKTSCK